jgi:hypothetical protein
LVVGVAIMSIAKTGEHKFKFLKKTRKGLPVGMWCETWFEADRTGKPIQKQKWLTPEEYEAL